MRCWLTSLAPVSTFVAAENRNRVSVSLPAAEWRTLQRRVRFGAGRSARQLDQAVLQSLPQTRRFFGRFLRRGRDIPARTAPVVQSAVNREGWPPAEAQVLREDRVEVGHGESVRRTANEGRAEVRPYEHRLRDDGPAFFKAD